MKRARITRCHRGFSLVELMVVVSIIGITVGVAYPYAIYKTRDAADKALASTIAQRIRTEKEAHNKLLQHLTGSTWSAQPCGADLFHTDACKNRMDEVMKKLGFDGAIKNPWGFVYAINENEGEHTTGGTECSKDRIISYRPLWFGGYLHPLQYHVPFSYYNPISDGSDYCK